VLELLKFIVQPVVLERDEDGTIVGERVGEATAMYSLSQIADFIATLQEQIDEANRSDREEEICQTNTKP
jgi:hypothetical protein